MFTCALLVSVTCSAWHGGYGGGYYHGGGGYYHGGGGYYNNGGYYHGGGSAVIIGAPGYGYGSYGPYVAPTPICQYVRYCDDNGQCAMQQECD